jgi:ATP-dependent Lhr-like helicase
LRALRRRSLARLRREVEPVEPAAYARFLPAWHGVAGAGAAAGGDAPGPAGAAGSAAALDRLAEVIAQLEGVPLPASVFERDVLASRVPGYGPRLLDELGAAGEICWVGRGRLGRDDGRIALYRPDRLALLLDPGGRLDPVDGTGATAGGGQDDVGGWVRHALASHLGTRGASFYRDLYAAALATARDHRQRSPTQRELLDALWDLAWDGLVTNDTFAPLRALRWRRPGGDARPRGVRLVPPEAGGRWSLVADGRASAAALAGTEPGETERRHAVAVGLLERQGIVTRDGVAAEAIPGGFAAVYPVLREMEDRGRARRGYFVEGLGGAQFALPGAVDRLRAERRVPGTDPFGEAGSAGQAGDAVSRILVLAAADPAQPYGGVLPWPRRGDDDRRPLPRAAGAYVVLVDGEPACYLERGGRSLQTLPVLDRPGLATLAFEALGRLVANGRLRNLQVDRIDGETAAASPFRPVLEAAGFRRGYRGWVLAVSPGARPGGQAADPPGRGDPGHARG